MMKIFHNSQKLNDVLELSKLLNSTKDPQTILDTLLKQSLEIIEGGDTGVIFMFNERTGLLEAKSFVGFDAEILKVGLKPGESMTGVSFIRKETLFLNSTEQANSAMSNMRQENRHIASRFKSRRFDNLKGSIVCPLIYQEQAIGVIVIDNYENEIPLKEEDVQILEAISVQATIALVNAIHFEREARNQENLKIVNRLLLEEKSKYLASLELHHQFTEMALKSYSLLDILHELNGRLEMDCLLVDLRLQVIEMSAPYFMTRFDLSPDLLLNQLELTEIPSQSQLEVQGLFVQAYPITVNDDGLGWLVCLAKEDGVSELKKLTLDQAVITLALELLKRNEMRIQEQSTKWDFLDAMLINQNQSSLEKAAQRFGFSFRYSHQFILMSYDPAQIELRDEPDYRLWTKSLESVFLRLESLVARQYPGTMCLLKDHVMTLILEFRKPEDAPSAFPLIQEFMQREHKRDPKNLLYASMSQLVVQLKEFKSAYQNAQFAHKLAIQFNQFSRPITIDELEVKKLLIANPVESLEEFLNKTLGPLLTYEKRSGQEFLNTLRLYIVSNGNWTQTKDQLHIHGNTLNYRLGRISEILNVSLDDYNQRFRIQLALEIADILSFRK